MINTLKLFFLSIFLFGCTYSITQVHTEGTASDVVDEEQTSTPDIKPTVTLTPQVIP